MSKFSNILKMSNDNVSEARAERWATGAERSARLIVEKLKSNVERLEEELDNLTDISTSNDLQTANRVGTFNSEDFVNKIFDVEEKLALAEDKLGIAKIAYEKWFETSTED